MIYTSPTLSLYHCYQMLITGRWCKQSAGCLLYNNYWHVFWILKTNVFLLTVFFYWLRISPLNMNILRKNGLLLQVSLRCCFDLHTPHCWRLGTPARYELNLCLSWLFFARLFFNKRSGWGLKYKCVCLGSKYGSLCVPPPHDGALALSSNATILVLYRSRSRIARRCETD